MKTADHGLTKEHPPHTHPTKEFNRIKKVILIQDPDSIPPNEPLTIHLNSISRSNVQKIKIARFARKNFESRKINDEVKTSTNWKENVKINEL